jgi:TatD DNase family protein
MIDSHAHIYLEDFDLERESLILRAQQAGIRAIMLPLIDANSITRMEFICKQYQGLCFPMLGLHPCYIPDDHFTTELQKIWECFERIKPIAVGEIGIDLHWKKDNLSTQISVLEHQMEWAQTLHLPVALHTREAFKETYSLVRQFKQVKGVFHCFTGTIEEAHQAIELGYYLGIGGVVTYKTSTLSAVLKEIGPHSLILETDSPYLTPVPFRGKINEPSYLIYIAKEVARATGYTLSEIESITDNNAKILFDI